MASCGGYTFAVRERERLTGESHPGRIWLATTADLCQGFHQLRIAPECRPLTAFTIPGVHTKEGHLQFACCPFGLSTLPTPFHQVVGQAIGDMHYGDLSIGKDRGAAQKNSGDMTEAEAKEAAEVEWQG